MITQIILALILIFLILYFLPFNSLKKKMPTQIQSFTNFKNIPSLDIRQKPYIWIYIENQYNSLKWPSFGSRMSLNNTESYLQLCMQFHNQNYFLHCG